MEFLVINWAMSTISSFVGSAYSRNSVKSVFKADSATLEAAQIHYQASRVSKRTAVTTTVDVCKCCSKRICGGNGACLFDLRDLDQLAPIGIAFPLFFYLIRYLCYMLLWVTLMASIGNMYFMYTSSPSTDPDYDETNTTVWPYTLHFIALLGLFVGYVLMTKLMKNKEAELKKGVVTEADYSVVIKNLGRDWRSAALKQHIEGQMLVNGKSISVANINASYLLTDYLLIEETVERIKQKKNTLEIQSEFRLARWLQPSNSHTETITQTQIHSEETALLARIEELEHRPPEKTGVAVVTFHTIQDAAAFYKEWSQGLLRKLFWCCMHKKDSPLYFAGREMYVKTADQPRDIAWDNLHVGRGKRIQAQAVTLAVIIIAVYMLYFVVIILAVLKFMANSEKGVKGYIEKGPVSAIVLGVGLGIEKLARFLAKIEHHHSYSAQFVIIAYKLTVMQVFNAVFFPVFYAIASEDFYTVLRGQMSSLIYMNAFVKPWLRLLGPVLYFARKWWVSRKLKAGKSTLTQEAANETFQLPEIDMAIWYSDALTKFMLALMYTPLIPAAAPVFCAGFVLDYWIAKFILLRLASTPNQLNGALALKMMEFVKFSILLYSVGMMMFFPPDASSLNLAASAFSLAFFYFIIPFKICCRCCFSTSKPLKLAGTLEEETPNFPPHEVIPT